jgi:ureidoacrylate peracid hydrolase
VGDAVSELLKPFIDPRDTALLIIDMQNGFCHPESQMGRASGTSAQQAIVPHIARLVAWARAEHIPVLWSRQVHLPNDATRARRRLASHAQRQGFLPCLRGTWECELTEEVQALVRPDDLLIEKHRASVFFDTNLGTKLRMLATQTLLIAGCNTEFCVESTVRDAYARDFDLVIVRDCVAGIRPDFHEEALRRFQAYFGEVLTVDELAACVLSAPSASSPGPPASPGPQAL